MPSISMPFSASQPLRTSKSAMARSTLRQNPGETFLAAYRRLGKRPFQDALYGRPVSSAKQPLEAVEAPHV